MVRILALGIAVALGAAGMATAQTSDEQAACKDDAFRVCSDAIPDRDRVAKCLIVNKDAISQACRTVMARFMPPDPAPAKTSAPRGRQGRRPLDLNPAARNAGKGAIAKRAISTQANSGKRFYRYAAVEIGVYYLTSGRRSVP